MPYQCDGGDNEPVVVIITNQIEAETVAFCQGHFGEWVAAVYYAFNPEPEPASTPARKPRKGKATAEPPETPDGPPEPVEDPATGDDTDEDEARDAAPAIAAS